MALPPLLPLPAEVRPGPGPAFRFRADDGVAGDTDAADALARATAPLGLALPRRQDGRIVLRIVPGGAPESYTLTADAASVVVTGADAAGLFFGVQTLAQLIVQDAAGTSIPVVEIADAPRFAYRGAMLDVARHFHPVETVEAYIDRLAALKLNHLHLHLTDDQGWRIALDARPELAARASATAVGGDPGGHYTADDYRRLVAYAATRHVTVVPEIDVPGHTHAVGLAYPAIAADPVVSDAVRAVGGALPVAGEPYTGIAVGFSSLRADADDTAAFLSDVYGEIAALTPGPYVHLGGDEAHGTDRAAYEALVRAAVAAVAATGKTPIAWHEAGSVAGLPSALVAQYWGLLSQPSDAEATARAVVAAGGRVILSPADAVYLDMKEHVGQELGLTWANGATSVRRAYGWDPADAVPGLDATAVLGVEAPLWSETVRTLADVDALAFPRIAAAAEIAWSPAPGPAAPERSWTGFRDRAERMLPRWAAAGVAVRPADDVAWGDA